MNKTNSQYKLIRFQQSNEKIMDEGCQVVELKKMNKK